MHKSTFLSILMLVAVIVTGGLQTASGASDTATVNGSVTTPNGQISNFPVALRKVETQTLKGVGETVTNSQGIFKFENIAGGMYIISARINGTEYNKIVTVKDGVATPSTVNLAIISSVEGRISFLNGSPVFNVAVNVTDFVGQHLFSANTTRDGTYNLRYLLLDETYEVSFIVKGVLYSESVLLRNVTNRVNFTVYPTTTSDKDMNVDFDHIILTTAPGYLNVSRAISFFNTGSAVFNNSKLKVSLPQGIQNLQTTVMECCVYPSPEGVAVDPMEPIKPNESWDMSLSYALKAEGSEKSFEKKIDYLTRSLLVIVEKKSGVQVSDVKNLEFSGTTEMGGREFLLYQGLNLTPTTLISLRVSGIQTKQELPVWLPLAIVAVGAVVAYPLMRRISRMSPSLESLLRRKEALFASMVELDEHFEQSKIGKREYEERSMAFKNAGRNLLKKIEKAKQHKPDGEKKLTHLSELRAEKKALQSTIQRLEEDYEHGKTSKEAYRKLKETYETRKLEVQERIRHSRSGESEGEAGGD